MSTVFIFNLSTFSKMCIANLSILVCIFTTLMVSLMRGILNFTEKNSSIFSFNIIVFMCTVYNTFSYHKDMKNYNCYFIEVLLSLIFHLFSTIQLKLILFLCTIQDRVQNSFFFTLYWYKTNSVPLIKKQYFPNILQWNINCKLWSIWIWVYFWSLHSVQLCCLPFFVLI